MKQEKGGSLSSPYVISHEKMNLYISILDISSLHLHEETIPELLNALVETIRRDKVLKHPIIVDKRTLVVLDGMHRVAALERLNCEKIPVCLIDYENPAVTIGCWYRTIKGKNKEKDLNSQIQRLGTAVEEVRNLDETSIGVSPIIAAVKKPNKSFLLRSPFKSFKEAYEIIGRLENHLRKDGFKIGYETEADALRMLERNEVDAVLLTPKLTKEAVIETALSGKVFTYKATRHVIPARPLFLNVSLSLLKACEKSLDEVNRELKNMLEKKRLKKILAGSLLDGRRYEEDVYIFEE
jgi:hypothetical protein